MRNIILPLLSLVLFLSACGIEPRNNSFSLIEEDEKKITALLNKMSIEEKVGQTCQITLDAILQKDESNKLIEPHQIDLEKLDEAINKYKVGSILNVSNHTFTLEKWNGIVKTIQDAAAKSSTGVPIIYGVDAIHGATYIQKSTLFPQEIGLAASWDTSLAREMGRITAYETRASGVPWNFSPVLDLGRKPIWSRFFETLGEDVYLAKTLGSKIVDGYQGGTSIDKNHVAACLKHYVGYGFPRTGRDRTPALIPERTMLEHHLPPFKESIKNGALTVMVNSGEVNGIPGHANKHLLTDVLKKEWGFSGFAVSDWEDFINLYKVAQTDSTIKDAIATAINAGVDMSMVPNNPEYKTYCEELTGLVGEGGVTQQRLDDAVRRILRVKYRLDLFENPYTLKEDYPNFASKEHIEKAYLSAAESITLLKNKEGVLPAKKSSRVMVIGPTANSLNCLNGAWTHTWQGVDPQYNNSNNPTIYEAVKESSANCDLYEGSIMKMVDGDEADFYSPDLKTAVKNASKYDLAVVCVGELPSTERPGDIYRLDLAKEQQEIVKSLSKTGIKIVLVLVEGRPKIISEIEPLADAVIQCYLPGDQGGRALADIIFGKTNPSGKLPYTYPRHSGVIMHYDHKQSEVINANTWANDFFNPQYNFGFGLSYTDFEYSNLVIDKNNYNLSEQINVTVDVKNVGKREGKEVVQLYTRDHFATISPPLRKLIRYNKIVLRPGETKTVSFNVSPKDLGFYNAENVWINEPGKHSFYVDVLEDTFSIK
ncbi:MAG: glycoside hydrolase family 3 N-terminal domain-containing protein [Flavobacteriales bacterium]